MSDPLTDIRKAVAGRYELGRQIGHGSFATIYLARDLRHERDVAFKILNADAASETGELRFIREIRLLARLQHPNILPLIDSGHVGTSLYYVMPYVRGETLRGRIDRERQLSVDVAVTITREIADGLAHAHAQGIIHRDIKPDNILLSGGHAVLADFGIARALDMARKAQITRSGVASLGTPAYMSPEQFLGNRELDARSDIYSLGCVLYEMLTGRAPFSGKGGLARRFTEDPPHVSSIRPEVPKWLDDVVCRAIARECQDRHPSASELARALEPRAHELPSPRQHRERDPAPAGHPLESRLAPIASTRLEAHAAPPAGSRASAEPKAPPAAPRALQRDAPSRSLTPRLAIALGILLAGSVAATLLIRNRIAAGKTNVAAGAFGSDTTDIEALLVAARVAYEQRGDWLGAERTLRRAVTLAPAVAPAHHAYSLFLRSLGRHEDAVAEQQLAIAAQGDAVLPRVSLATTYYMHRDYARAIAEARRAIALDSLDGIAHGALGIFLAADRRFPEAIREGRRGATGASLGMGRALLARIYAMAGQPSRARAMLDSLMSPGAAQDVDPYFVAGLHAALGERDSTMTWLERAFAAHSERVMDLATDPQWDSVRSDPRFQALVGRLALPPDSPAAKASASRRGAAAGESLNRP